MKTIIKYLIAVFFLIFFISCENLVLEKNPENNPLSTFEVFWTNLDQRYAYFSLKNINWDSIYSEYKPGVYNEMPSNELWDILSDMLCELKDGHVNVIDNNRWSYWLNCKEQTYNVNFDYQVIVNNYLKRPIKYSGPLLYNILDDIGYIYIPDFESDVSDKDIDFLVNYFKDTKGLIIDIRSNGGGNSENVNIIESRLLNTRTLVEYIYYKNGPGHNDFTAPQEVHISPDGAVQYTKPIVVLINKESYSSASFFASRMSVLPHVSLIGDTTSGGGGRPKFFDLPNGWAVRYSSNYALRADGLNIENGVPPDFYVELKNEDLLKGEDTIIEYALSFLRSI